MFIIRRLKGKQKSIYDLFLKDLEGWAGWARISLFNGTVKQLDGRHLTVAEKATALTQIQAL